MSDESIETAPEQPVESPAPPVKWGRWVLLCAVLMGVLWGLEVHRYLNVANDAGRYTVLGKSIAENGQAKLINDVKELRDTLYPPGFPALIAVWIKVTGSPAQAILPIKAMQLALLLLGLPLLAGLTARAKLPPQALLIYALAPATLAYANEVMSEAPTLLLFLATAWLVESRKDEKIASSRILAAIAVAILCYFVRSAALVLFLTLTLWLARQSRPGWAAATAIVGLIVIVGWMRHTKAIIRNDPPNTHDTYTRQLFLRDGEHPELGRIPQTPRGILVGGAERLAIAVPNYIGQTPRSLLNSMKPAGPFGLEHFYLVAILITPLIFYGLYCGWKEGSLRFSALLWAVYWCFTVAWPWRNARFLIPVLPLTALFLTVGWSRAVAKLQLPSWTSPALAALLGLYFLRGHVSLIQDGRRPTREGYALGRTKDEAGFYAACEWLKANAKPANVVMGRPQYLIHLYSGLKTKQIEPTPNPKVHEMAATSPPPVQYLLMDKWTWAKTTANVMPSIQQFSQHWQLSWNDPLGSGVQIWRRAETTPTSSVNP